MFTHRSSSTGLAGLADDSAIGDLAGVDEEGLVLRVASDANRDRAAACADVG